MNLSSRELLRTLVAFDTSSHHSNLPMIDWVANYLLELGVESQRTYSPDGTKANLFATIGPLDIGGVCLHGHSDVVPVQGQPWHSDPFVLTPRDGLLFGRGTSDMKAWTACSLAAVPGWQTQRLRTPIHFSLSYDEELGCLGIPSMLALFGSQIPRPRMAIVGEPSLMVPIIAHKGLLALDTAIRGRDAHSSLLHLGVSALSAAAEMAVELHNIAKEWMDLPGPFGMRPSGPTLNVGQMRAGVARNLIPREAHLKWELRFRKTDDPDVLLREVLLRIQDRLRSSFGTDFQALKLETELLTRVPAFDAGIGGGAERLAQSWGAVGLPQSVPYGAEAGQFADAGIDTVICGPGSIEQAHQPNEFIAESQLEACDQFLARLGEWAGSEAA